MSKSRRIKNAREQDFQEKLSAYARTARGIRALAPGAAALTYTATGVLALAAGANAYVRTCADVGGGCPISFGINAKKVPVDIDGGGGNDLYFSQITGGYTNSLIVYPFVSVGIVNTTYCQYVPGNLCAENLAAPESIDNAQMWGGFANQMGLYFKNTSMPATAGNFPGSGYLGVKFQIGSNTHYGWVQFETTGSGTGGKITNWAYEEVPNCAIKAGATTGGCTGAPVVTLDPGALAYTENDPAKQISPNATVTDPDANLNNGTLTARITASAEAADRLSIMTVGTVTLAGLNVNVGGVTMGTANAASVTGATQLTITLNANATNAGVQEILRAIGFNNTSEDPGVAARTVTFTLIDAASDTDTKTRNINVTPENDPPTDITITNTSVDENRPVNSVVGTLGATDPDG